MRTLAYLLVFCAPLAAKWWKIESGPLTVYTDASERVARETFARLDLARRVFAGVSRAGMKPMPLEVVAFALASDARFRALRKGETTRGFYQSAPQRDYIVLHWGAADLSRVAFHEYVHLALNHTSGPLPQWLEEGLAELHSTLEARDGRVRIGRPVQEHLRLLEVRPWLSADELSRVDKESRHYNEADRAGVFYAQSWALVHMLRLHERYRQGFAAFLSAAQGGESQAPAFQRAFGKSLTDAIVDLKPYLERTRLPVADFPVEMDAAASGTRVTQLTELEGDMAYAGLASASGHPEEAEKIYRRLSRNERRNAQAETALGMLALAQKRHDDAKTHFETAMQFADAGADVHFEYAMLLRDTGGNRDDVKRHVEKAVGLNPAYAEAQFLLGLWYANESRHGDAVPHLEQAVSLFPRQSYFWHALALSYQALGKTEQAQRAARRAFDSAANPEQTEMARAAVRMAGSAREPGTVIQPEVFTPESWRNKEGDTRVEGVLERIDCLGRSARFHVRAGERALAFWVENPGEVLLKNLSSVTFEFHCGVQKAAAIVVEYKSQADIERGTIGVVTAIEFR